MPVYVRKIALVLENGYLSEKGSKKRLRNAEDRMSNSGKSNQDILPILRLSSQNRNRTERHQERQRPFHRKCYFS
jgi:hypothetical protein